MVAARAQITITSGQRDYTFLRYSNDGGKTFTPAKPWVETGEYGNGRNLASGTYDFSGGTENWGNLHLDTLSNEKYKGFSVLVEAADRAWGHRYLIADIRAGKTYTLSFFAKADRNTSRAMCSRRRGHSLFPAFKFFSIGTEWQRYSETFTALGTGTIGVALEKADTDNAFYVCGYKLEEGGTATDWTPSPEDRQLGTTPGKYLGTLVWDKPYPSMDTSAYTWSEVKGRDGNGIVSMRRMFAVGVSPTVEPTGYSETAPQMTPDKRYLWAYDIITYTDGTSTQTKHAVIGVYGEAGKNGKDGTNGKNGENGRPGADALSVQASSEYIIVDTADNGSVGAGQLANAWTDIKAYRGSEPASVVIKSANTSAGIGVKTSYRVENGVGISRVKIEAVNNDPATGYAYGSGYVDIVANVDNTDFRLRIFVGTNLHKLLNEWKHDNEKFKSDLTRLQNDYNGNKSTWNSRIEQNARAITQRVEQTIYNADTVELRKNIAEVKATAGRISAKVSERSERTYNLLKDTKTLHGTRVSVGSGVTLADRAVKDFTVATGKNTGSGNLDVLTWNDVELKPDTYYSLSFWAKGSGSFSCFLFPDACAEVVNSQGFTGTSDDGHNKFDFTPEWTFCQATFKTKAGVSGKKSVIPMRLHAASAGSVYGVCLVESAAPSVWAPYHNNPKNNYVMKPLGIFGQKATVTSESTVYDEAFGKVRRVSANGQGGYQLLWELEDDYGDLLEDNPVTMFAVVREETAGARWNFGGWSKDDTAHGSFNYLSEKSGYADLGDGWRKYYTTFYNHDGLLLWDGESGFGINSLSGTILVYGVGVVYGDECPEWNAVPLERALLDTGIDITNGHIRQVADHFEWVDNNGNPVAEFKDGTARFYGDVNARTFSTPNKTFTVDKDGNVTAKNMKAEGGTFSEVIVEGAVSSPYTTVGSGFDLTRHDNAWLGGNNEWVNYFNLRWDVSQRGRTLHLSNYGTSLPTTGVGKINAPSGKWFFDNGRKFSQLLVYPGTVVVLHGLGYENTFHGWLVEQRHDPSHNKTGVPFRAFAWGFATCSKTGDADFENYRTFDGSQLGISRLGAGWCRITMPYAWYSILQTYGSHWYHHFGVIATGYGYSEDGANEFCPIKASVKSMGLNGNTPYVDIWLSDDDTANDGCFQFIFYNMDFNDGFQTSDNR